MGGELEEVVGEIRYSSYSMGLAMNVDSRHQHTNITLREPAAHMFVLVLYLGNGRQRSKPNGKK